MSKLKETHGFDHVVKCGIFVYHCIVLKIFWLAYTYILSEESYDFESHDFKPHQLHCFLHVILLKTVRLQDLKLNNGALT